MTDVLPLVVALCPFVGAAAVRLAAGAATDPGVNAGRSPWSTERVRLLAVVPLLVALIAAVVSALSGGGSVQTGAVALGHGATYRAGVAVDGTGTILVPALLLAAVLAVIATPRRALGADSTSRALGVLGGALLVILATDGLLLALGWTLGATLSLSARPAAAATPGRRVVRGFALLRTVLLLAGLMLGVIAAWRDGAHEPLAVVSIVSASSPFAMATLVLVTLAGLARMAAFPFHLWLVPFADEAPPLVFAMTFAANAGIVVMLRLASPMAAQLVEASVPLVAMIGLFTALHASLRAVAETRLRRLVALVIGSQLGTVLVGASLLNDHAATGAMVGVAAVAIGGTGLLMLLNAVEVRVGAVALAGPGTPAGARAIRGLASAMPRASLAWFAIAFAVVGIPGSLSFVSEDLVLHGILHAHPIFAVLALLASVLNATTLVRAGASVFLGEPARTYLVPDLLLRERLAVLTVALVLFGAGFFPAPLVELASVAARELSF